MSSLGQLLKSLETAGGDVCSRLERVEKGLGEVNGRMDRLEAKVNHVQKLGDEQAELLGSLAREIGQIHQLLRELVPPDRRRLELPMEARPTVRMPAVSLDLLKGGAE